MKEVKPEGTYEQFGHGIIHCSCGKLLSKCGCHTGYGIIVKACKKCKSPKKIKIPQKGKSTKKVLPEKELRKILTMLKNKHRGHEE